MNTVCYMIHAAFPDIRRCPHCRDQVETRQLDIETTYESVSERAAWFFELAIIPGAATWLARCTKCGWWALRESLTDYETYNPPSEYLLMRLPDGDRSWPDPQAGEGSQEWQEALNDTSLWAEPVDMPLDQVAQMFGPRWREFSVRYLEGVVESHRVYVGKKIGHRRRELEASDPAYSLDEVAERIEVSASYLRQLESAEEAEPPSDELIERLCSDLRWPSSGLLRSGRILRDGYQTLQGSTGGP